MPYVCPLCKQLYRKLSVLKYHFKRVHLNELTCCPICGYKPKQARFSIWQALVKHCAGQGDERHLALLYLLHARSTSMDYRRRGMASRCARLLFKISYSPRST